MIFHTLEKEWMRFFDPKDFATFSPSKDGMPSEIFKIT
jgi:hypothetical protein